MPEHWLHPRQRGCNWEHKQYRLTMIMLDTFDCEEDNMNVLATTIYRRMRSENYTPDDIIYGTVYIGNANADEVIDLTKESLTYICKQVLKPKVQITSRNIAYILYIQTWTCRTLRRNQSARKKQRSNTKSSRSSAGTTESTTTHTKKKASECERCKKTFSSVNALRTHQVKNLKCKLLQATETTEKFDMSG